MGTVIFHKGYSNEYSDSPVAGWLDDFAAWLAEVDYREKVRPRHMAIVRWVLERDAPVPPDLSFDEEDLDRLFRSPVRPRTFAAARWAFEQFLRARGRWVMTEPVDRHQPLLNAYAAQLRELRGLAPATIDLHLRTARLFLALCAAPPRTPASWAPRDVERFMARRARHVSRSGLQAAAGHLRAFLSFCHERGECPDRLDEIDRPHVYRNEKPPRAIPWTLSQRLLASIDRRNRIGCRDHAVLYVMAHFGLRTGEVAALRLEHFDAKARTLRVPQSKTRSLLVLPLSARVARILTHYVRHGRPRTSRPELFLSMLAPLRPMTRGAIAELFRRRVHASGLPLTEHSPYGLRHGFAMRLLERGVGVKAIGDLLGHHTLESTCVYLRLNTEALRDVALPVPATRTGAERRVS